MPAFSTHYIFALEILEKLKRENFDDFKINRSAVLLGTQGPDVFFDHRVMPWMFGRSLLPVGSLLHRAKPADIFTAMRKYIPLSQDKDTAKSYALGFILHYSLDRKCHPYVYFLQNKITKKNPLVNPHSAHNAVEFSMDSYLLSKRMGIKEPSKFDSAETLDFDSKTALEAGKMLSFTVYEAIGRKVTPKQAAQAFYDLKYIQKISTDKTGVKTDIILFFETLLAPFMKNFKFTAMMRPKDLKKAEKYGNLYHERWYSPKQKGIMRNESFEDLFEEAEKEATDMIKRFFAGEDCYEITNNISFLTGVEVK